MKSALGQVVEAYNSREETKLIKPKVDAVPVTLAIQDKYIKILDRIDEMEPWVLHDKFILNNIKLRYDNLCKEISEMTKFQKLFHKDKIEEFYFYQKLYELAEKEYPTKS